jgi:hypothetical protein
MKDLIDSRVYYYYWNQDLNCANTTVNVLSELFNTKIQPQVVVATFGFKCRKMWYSMWISRRNLAIYRDLFKSV